MVDALFVLVAGRWSGGDLPRDRRRRGGPLLHQIGVGLAFGGFQVIVRGIQILRVGRQRLLSRFQRLVVFLLLKEYLLHLVVYPAHAFVLRILGNKILHERQLLGVIWLLADTLQNRALRSASVDREVFPLLCGGGKNEQSE